MTRIACSLVIALAACRRPPLVATAPVAPHPVRPGARVVFRGELPPDHSVGIYGIDPDHGLARLGISDKHRMAFLTVDLHRGVTGPATDLSSPCVHGADGMTVEQEDVDHLMLVDRDRHRRRLDPTTPAGYDPCFFAAGTRVLWRGYDPIKHFYYLYAGGIDGSRPVQIAGTRGSMRPTITHGGSTAFEVRFDRERGHLYTDDGRGPDRACLTRVDLGSLTATDLACIDNMNQVALFVDPSGRTGVLVSQDSEAAMFDCTASRRDLDDGHEIARYRVRCGVLNDDAGFVTDDGVLLMAWSVIDLVTGRRRVVDADPKVVYDWMGLRDAAWLDRGVVPMLRFDAHAYEIVALDLRAFLDEDHASH